MREKLEFESVQEEKKKEKEKTANHLLCSRWSTDRLQSTVQPPTKCVRKMVRSLSESTKNVAL